MVDTYRFPWYRRYMRNRVTKAPRPAPIAAAMPREMVKNLVDMIGPFLGAEAVSSPEVAALLTRVLQGRDVRVAVDGVCVAAIRLED